MAVWVALLRGINLGSHNKLAMPALRTALSDAGFVDVRTYVQSGNVVLRSSHRSPAAVARAVQGVVRECSGVDTPVIVRTPDQLREVLTWDPFPQPADARPTTVHVVHLDRTPAPAAVDAVLTADWGKDEIAVRGPEAVLHYAESMHGSRLQAVTVLRRLGVDGTARNWRTLCALVGLCG